jgi:hypothetical protein
MSEGLTKRFESLHEWVVQAFEWVVQAPKESRLAASKTGRVGPNDQPQFVSLGTLSKGIGSENISGLLDRCIYEF